MVENTETTTFQKIRGIQRKEKDEKRLHKLDSDFYGIMGDYYRARKKELENNPIDTQLLHKIGNTRQLIKEIYRRRERKIIDLALNDSRSDSQCPEVSDMVPHEKKLYGALIKILNEHRDRYYLPLFNDDKGAAPMPIPVESPAPVQLEGNAPADAEDDLLNVEFLTDVPRTLGMDAKEYGPFRRGERALIPAANAENLINRGKARSAEA